MNWKRLGFTLVWIAAVVVLMGLIVIGSQAEPGETLFVSPPPGIGAHQPVEGFYGFFDRSGAVASENGLEPVLILRWYSYIENLPAGHWMLHLDHQSSGYNLQGPVGVSGSGVENWITVANSNLISGTVTPGEMNVKLFYRITGQGDTSTMAEWDVIWPDGPMNSFFPIQIWHDNIPGDGYHTAKLQMMGWLTATQGVIPNVWRNNHLPQLDDYVYTVYGSGGSQHGWASQKWVCDFDHWGVVAGDCVFDRVYWQDPFRWWTIVYFITPNQSKIGFAGTEKATDDCSGGEYTFPCYFELYEHDGSDAEPWRVATIPRYTALDECCDCTGHTALPIIFKDYP